MPRRPKALIASVAVLATCSLALAGCGLLGTIVPEFRDGGQVSAIGAVDFVNELTVPPLAESTVVNGERRFDLTAAPSETEFIEGEPTTTWGYNQSYLGPTLVAERGEKVRVSVHNELEEMTTIHWHGMHLPAAMDGGPHQPIEPGDDRDPHWTIEQPAATLWYHPHPHGDTEDHVANGLAGMFILQDPEEAALDLPRNYGKDDIPVIVQDARFHENGSFDHGNRGFVGSLGNQLIVDGTIGPYLDVTTEAVRLRLLNASTARVYDFGFDDGREFDQIATDGGLLEQPLKTDHVQLSPGERAEIVVLFTPGETVVLQSTPPDLGITNGGGGPRNGGADSFDVLELRAASSLESSAAVPSKLATFDELGTPTVERSMRLDNTEINGQEMELTRIDNVVEVGSTEAWTVRNEMDLPHNFHVHDVQFLVDSIGGEAPPAELAGWKDTVYLRPHTDYRLVMRFADYTSTTEPYMYHCHLLWHEDQGMMGQFVVVKPGQVAGTIQGESNDDHHH
jgi:FtsP/CotA-like multicopper oxidase with cupredoxin domain